MLLIGGPQSPTQPFSVSSRSAPSRDDTKNGCIGDQVGPSSSSSSNSGSATVMCIATSFANQICSRLPSLNSTLIDTIHSFMYPPSPGQTSEHLTFQKFFFQTPHYLRFTINDSPLCCQSYGQMHPNLRQYTQHKQKTINFKIVNSIVFNKVKTMLISVKAFLSVQRNNALSSSTNIQQS